MPESSDISAEWIFDPAAPSGAKKGGLANAQVLDPSIDTFVREVLQNSRDQRLSSSDAVEVQFRLVELEGTQVGDFLTAMDWAGLEPHISAAAEQGGITIAGRLKEGLGEIAEARLRLLAIEDSRTRGLTGGEDEDESNFNALCRHELITSAARRDAGGSFGIGKSVLWRFSSLSTVLFASRPNGEDRVRYFGRVLLPWHSVADQGGFEGSGWLGNREPTPAGDRAVSVWGDQAEALAAGTFLERSECSSGTTILVVGFDEPALEIERPLKAVAEQIVSSASRWFWPALRLGQLKVTVSYGVAGTPLVAEAARHDLPEIRPFVLALNEDPVDDEHLGAPGEVARREVTLAVPEQREVLGLVESPRKKLEVPLTLVVRVAESGEEEHLNTVALQRGTGMVVAYEAPKRPLGGDARFHAVLLAGRANGDDDTDMAAEEFLRAAERPSHSEWTSRTERIKSEYKPGAEAGLRQLFAQIDAVLRELFRVEVTESDDGPEALRRLFPLPGAGPLIPRPFYRLDRGSAEVQGDGWTFAARYSRQEPGEEPWRFRLRLLLDQESGGRNPEIVPIRECDAEGATILIEEGGDAVIVAPADCTEVVVSGRSVDLLSLPADGLHRVRLRLDVLTLTTA